jgi:hypothetical protein
MSTKSKLYELIQLSQNSKFPVRLDRPIFNDEDDFDQGTNTHYMTCRASIEINGEKKNFISNVFTNKKDANQNACEKIYRHVTELEPDTTPQSNGSKKFQQIQSVGTAENQEEIVLNKCLLILIDYENVSVDKEIAKLMSFLENVVCADMNAVYEGYSDSESNESNESPIEVIKFAGHAASMKNNADIVVKSTRRDAVDHYIGFYLGQRIGKNPSLSETHSVHILSRDRFASCLSDFCENVTHNVDVDDLIDSIRQISESIS